MYFLNILLVSCHNYIKGSTICITIYIPPCCVSLSSLEDYHCILVFLNFQKWRLETPYSFPLISLLLELISFYIFEVLKCYYVFGLLHHIHGYLSLVNHNNNLLIIYPCWINWCSNLTFKIICISLKVPLVYMKTYYKLYFTNQ
jgi:hypothetical protein